MAAMRNLRRPTAHSISGLLFGLLVNACGAEDPVTPRQPSRGTGGSGSSETARGGSTGMSTGMGGNAIVVVPTEEATPPNCGDGSLTSDEACDDGNTQSGDGC